MVRTMFVLNLRSWRCGFVTIRKKKYILHDIERLALDCWPYAQRFYDPYKKIVVGKDVHNLASVGAIDFGKYLNKVVASEYSLGEKYIPYPCISVAVAMINTGCGSLVCIGRNNNLTTIIVI